MKLFIIIFTVALLFVIGSAGMMRFFDNRMVKPGKLEEDKKDKKNKEQS